MKTLEEIKETSAKHNDESAWRESGLLNPSVAKN